MINPILDKDFLKELDAHREKEVWARITALTVKEEPVEEILTSVEEVKEIIEDEKENKITIIYKNYKLKHYKLIRKDVDSDIKRY